MQFVTDENVEPAIDQWLRTLGHDVLSIRDSFAGIDDDEVLKHASESGRVLITYDRDFGEMVYRQGMMHNGIVLLRMSSCSVPVRLAHLQSVWPLVCDRLIGAFIVVADNRLRIRKPDLGESREGQE